MTLELYLGAKTISSSPTEEDVLKALSSLQHKDDFLVLSHSPAEFVQMKGTLLECRENDTIYRAKAEEIDIDLAGNIFLSFLRGDQKWKQLTEWQDVTDEIKAERNPNRIIVSLSIVAVLVVLGWVFKRVFL